MRTMPRRLVSLGLVIALSVTGGNPAHADQQIGAAAYLDWSGAVLSETSGISQVIEPLEISPFTDWEAGWKWDNAEEGGYGGIHSKGTLADGTVSDLAIFSIRNALGAVPGEGAGCLPFSGEGIGYSCRIPVTLVAGNKYEISFKMDSTRGPKWWIATISDLAKGTKKVIGSIEANTTMAMASNWTNSIEYWGPAVLCDEVGQASAKFFVPTSDNPDIEVFWPRFSRPSNSCVMSAGDTPPRGYIGDAVIRFGGYYQFASTETLPFTKTKAQLARDKADADKLAASLKKITITCVKGKLVKKVTAYKPLCPKGYKKR